MKIKNKIFSNLYIIFLIIFVFIIYYYFHKIIVENYENNQEKKITIIIARYKEDISYLLKNKFNNYHIIIYNKGNEIENKEINDKFDIIQLPNVGKCDHTYLYHIIKNYHHLSDITIFLPASFYHMKKKRKNAFNVLNQVKKNQNTVFPIIDYKKPINKNKELYNYVEETYVSRFIENQDKENHKYLKTKLSPIRPYGKWFEKNFPNNQCPYVCYMGIFAISKEDIQKNKIEKYKELISYVDNHINPEASFFIERCWVPLFYPIDENKLLRNTEVIW